MVVFRASEAWLRVGLHERKHGQFDDAIKRFDSIAHCHRQLVRILSTICVSKKYFGILTL